MTFLFVSAYGEGARARRPSHRWRIRRRGPGGWRRWRVGGHHRPPNVPHGGRRRQYRCAKSRRPIASLFEALCDGLVAVSLL